TRGAPSQTFPGGLPSRPGTTFSCLRADNVLCEATARRGVPLTTSEREVVAALGEAIARRIGEPRYNLWFAGKTKFTWDDQCLAVGVPNHFYQEWLHKTFADAVRAAAADVLGRPLQVRFALDPELSAATRGSEDRGSRIEDRGSKEKPTGDSAPAGLCDLPSSILDPRSS